MTKSIKLKSFAVLFMLNMSARNPLSVPAKTIAEQVLEQLREHGKSRWILVEYKPVYITESGNLVTSNLEIFVPITNYKKLKKDLSNYQAIFWHPKKRYSVPCHFRVKTYKEHNINPNEAGIRVVRFVARESKDAHVKRFIEIEMLPVTKLDHEPKYKLIILRAYGKSTFRSGAKCKLILDCECKRVERHIVISDLNESATGAHWYYWYVILMPRNEKLYVNWYWHGARKLVKDVNYEL